MLYLIDGYNLLHALGVLAGRQGPTGLERARLRLLGLLRGALGDEASAVTVVFDAAQAPPGTTSEQVYHGIHVTFAVDQEQADDLIELLIQRTAAPKGLTVISDDHRIQQAARRRQCIAWSCGECMDWLERRRRPRPPPAREMPAKPESTSRQETQHWLEEFGGLEDTPEFKELRDPYGFGDE